MTLTDAEKEATREREQAAEIERLKDENKRINDLCQSTNAELLDERLKDSPTNDMLRDKITELEATIDMANKTYKLTLQDITLADRVAELEAEVERQQMLTARFCKPPR